MFEQPVNFTRYSIMPLCQHRWLKERCSRKLSFISISFSVQHLLGLVNDNRLKRGTWRKLIENRLQKIALSKPCWPKCNYKHSSLRSHAVEFYTAKRKGNSLRASGVEDLPVKDFLDVSSIIREDHPWGGI